MPRPRNNPGNPTLSPGQAHYVLERLIGERRISAGEINRYVGEMGREISDLEARLQRLREAQGGGGTGSGAAAPARRGRRPGRPGRPPGRPPGRRPGRPPAAAAAAAVPAAKAGRRRGRRRSAITPEQLASRQLQGRYLALVRQFSENKRAQYAKIAKERGREAAIRDMQDALRK